MKPALFTTASRHMDRRPRTLGRGPRGVGRQGLASAALGRIATLTSLDFFLHRHRRSRRAVLALSLNSNRILQHLDLSRTTIITDMENLVKDRHRFYNLVLKLASWVASAARGVELCDDNLVIPPALAARAAVLAFGNELMDLELPDGSDSQWLSQGGRDMAAAQLLPRAEAALRQELQRLADAVRRAREGGESSSSSSSRAL